MLRRFARRMTHTIALLAIAFAPKYARAAPDPVRDVPPRDVGIVPEAAAAALPALPSDFVTEDGGWVVLDLPASIRDRAAALEGNAAAFRAHLAADLGQPVLDHVHIRIARTADQMADLAPEGAPPPRYAAGVAYPALGLVLLALQAPHTWEAPDLVELVRHELTHIALNEAVAGHHVPRWFDEGFAIHESGELPWARTKELWDASLGKRLLPLSDLDRGFPADGYDVNVAYAESADVMRFLMRDPDRARFGSLVDRVRSGETFARALEDAYATDVRKLEYEWREEVSHRFNMVPLLTGSGMLWVVASGLAIAAWWKRRKRAKAKLAAWAREEAEMDAALATARDRPEVVAAAPTEEAMPPMASPGVPVVEHQGRWYTLH